MPVTYGLMALGLDFPFYFPVLLGGSWDLVSKALSTLIGVISSTYRYPNYDPSY